jgi:hypothetical protein
MALGLQMYALMATVKNCVSSRLGFMRAAIILP